MYSSNYESTLISTKKQFSEQEWKNGYEQQGLVSLNDHNYYTEEVKKQFKVEESYSFEMMPINPQEISEEENEYRLVYVDMLLGEAETTIQQRIKQILLTRFTSDTILELQTTYSVDRLFHLEEQVLIKIEKQLNSLINAQ